jgi:hypothetical protein
MRSRMKVLSAIAALATATTVLGAAASAQLSVAGREPTGTTMAAGLISPAAWLEPSGLYFGSATSKQVTANTDLRRVNPTSGRVYASQTVEGVARYVAEADGKIWVQSQTQINSVSPGPAVVTALNPATLRVDKTITFGQSAPARGLVAAGGSVWAADSEDLVRIDPATMKVTKTIGAGTTVVDSFTSAVTDSRGRSLVTGLDTPGGNRIQRRNAHTGDVEATSAAMKVGALADTVYDNGVWVAVSTGNSGYLERLSLTSLDVTATPTAAAGSNDGSAAIYGGHLFVIRLTTPTNDYCGNVITGTPEAVLTNIRHGLLLTATATTFYYIPNTTSASDKYRIQRDSLPTLC